MSDFFEIFQPGLRYKREQDDLEKVLVVEADRGGSGPEPLDLDSGSVVLRLPAPAPRAEETGPDAATAEDA